MSIITHRKRIIYYSTVNNHLHEHEALEPLPRRLGEPPREAGLLGRLEGSGVRGDDGRLQAVRRHRAGCGDGLGDELIGVLQRRVGALGDLQGRRRGRKAKSAEGKEAEDQGRRRDDDDGRRGVRKLRTHCDR